MRLADRIAQCQTPFIVQNPKDGAATRLNSAACFSKEIETCVTRYVLSDELTRLCTALAYSKGAKTLACADLLYVPAQRVWIEWTEAPRRRELERYGFKRAVDSTAAGRRGIYIQSTPQARSGVMRTFWSNGDAESDVLVSSMEAYFDFDTQTQCDPAPHCDVAQPSFCVFDDAAGYSDILRRCFRFRFERTWHEYYDSARLAPTQSAALARHALGTIAIDVPVVLAFLLLLTTRPSLPRRPLMLERINQLRGKAGKTQLLDHIEVFSPMLPEFRAHGCRTPNPSRRSARLHHVRGHLVRRGSQIFWRVPHLRGNARAGALRSRTVTWTIDSRL